MLQRINKILKPETRAIRGLILVPTRELVDQVGMAITHYGRHLKVKYTKIQGGVTKNIQIEKLATGIDIIVASTGRLESLIQEGKIDLSNVNMIVLDEADTMLEMSFLPQIEFILSNCARKRQILMFSATISQNIRKLGKKYLVDPVVVEVSERRSVVALIKHRAIKVDVKSKSDLLVHLIQQSKEQILVFVNTKEMANIITPYLYKKGIKAVATHGDIEYQARVNGLKGFRNGKIQVLVATDIAGRGIDIKDLPLVINYELPEATDDFTHRIGRTGRANKKGNVISLLNVTDYNHFTKIERDLRLTIKREVIEDYELKDRQPRQKQMKKVSKKARTPKKHIKKTGAKSKKTTKRDANRVFRK
jgi:ATP-dependent RNA helicase RhlE